MTLKQEMAADFAAIHSEIPASVELAGRSIHALVSEGELSEQLDAGGFGAVRAISVRILKADAPRKPKVGEKLTCDGATYRIAQVNDKPALPFFNIECQQE